MYRLQFFQKGFVLSRLNFQKGFENLEKGFKMLLLRLIV